MIYNENCLDTMKRLPDNHIDLVVTSPPYDNLRDYKGWYAFDFEPIARELFRVVKNGGVVVWVVNDATVNGSETGTSFRQALYFKEVGFNLHDTMIYKKNVTPFPEVVRYYPSFEYMFVFSKGTPKVINLIADKRNASFGSIVSGGQRNPDGSFRRKSGAEKNAKIKEYSVRPNVWEYAVGGGATTTDKFAFEHPAMFPEKLAAEHILSWSNKGCLVYDPFGGAGTTAKMAEILERRWITSEISEEYCDIIKRRIGLVRNNLFNEL